MKIEKRGKYPGVKVHLDKEDCQALITNHITKGDGKASKLVAELSLKIGSKIRKLQDEYPTLLDERTDDEIKEELELEAKAAGDKLAAIAKGKDWKKVKVS